ncbi:DUF6415 family natural product biosynthesis protein [Streptomyces cinnabarinus]|uniref:DUF6415 family natural product biosynthesis protein n=1 Tax=Streptomyces cinnabarinus TaxID=67287 RepID=A0ABY7KQT7_9ACTN|nr:DUF6415 family natural product biosynthesis protein [Streptomyces cinnabarinus]WAZ26955.1 DUF6415 family natural product biosynthesis protein [Streptomyces cinnabarinus]
MSAELTETPGRSAPAELVDIVTMRASVAQVLPPEVTPTDRVVLAALTGMLRGHMHLLIPEVEQAAAALPADDVPRYVALACVGEARGKLDVCPGLMPSDAQAYVRRLGRSLLALCDHYEALTGIRMCLACDREFESDEERVPYDVGSPSGGAARSGYVHPRCANTVRHTGR